MFSLILKLIPKHLNLSSRFQLPILSINTAQIKFIFFPSTSPNQKSRKTTWKTIFNPSTRASTKVPFFLILHWPLFASTHWKCLHSQIEFRTRDETFPQLHKHTIIYSMFARFLHSCGLFAEIGEKIAGHSERREGFLFGSGLFVKFC